MKPLKRKKDKLKIPENAVDILRLVNKAALADQLNISRSYVSLILSGNRSGGKYQGKILEYLKKIHAAA